MDVNIDLNKMRALNAALKKILPERGRSSLFNKQLNKLPFEEVNRLRDISDSFSRLEVNSAYCSSVSVTEEDFTLITDIVSNTK